MLLPEPGLWVFKRAEHEFLRIAAMANPDWGALAALTHEPAFAAGPGGEAGWQYVMNRANEHQLGGVVRWRFLDEHLDGVCPDWVREEARGHLTELDAGADAWKIPASRIIDRLNQSGIPWLLSGSLPCYALYRGLEDWPRQMDDIDIYIPSSLYREAQGALSEFGISAYSPLSPYLASPEIHPDLPSPFFLEVLTYPSAYDYSRDAIRGDAAMFRDIRTISVGGVDLPVPAPPAWVAMLAYRTYGAALEWEGNPLPLAALARIHNIAVCNPPFDWEGLVTLLQHFRAKTERRIEATASAFRGAPASEEPTLLRRSCLSLIVLYVLQLADQAYQFVPAEFWARVETVFGKWSPPLILGLVGADHGPSRGYATWFEWVGPADVETICFQHYGTTGAAARVAAGLWKPCKPDIKQLVDEPEWFPTSMGPIIAA